jgi:hypothetical protein
MLYQEEGDTVTPVKVYDLKRQHDPKRYTIKKIDEKTYEVK